MYVLWVGQGGGMCDAGAAGWMWRKVTSARLTGLAFAYKKKRQERKEVKESDAARCVPVAFWLLTSLPSCLSVAGWRNIRRHRTQPGLWRMEIRLRLTSSLQEPVRQQQEQLSDLQQVQERHPALSGSHRNLAGWSGWWHSVLLQPSL